MGSVYVSINNHFREIFMMENFFDFEERIIDTLDSREILNTGVKSIVEDIEFFTQKRSYHSELLQFSFGNEIVLF